MLAKKPNLKVFDLAIEILKDPKRKDPRSCIAIWNALDKIHKKRPSCGYMQDLCLIYSNEYYKFVDKLYKHNLPKWWGRYDERHLSIRVNLISKFKQACIDAAKEKG